tara:strand:+ start:4510 stop:5028 length:519 start_codon:yes stop_codon:yes gene_type:complete
MKITVWVNLKNNMKLENIRWPVYVLHSDEIEERDGLLYCDTQIVDDKNMKGESLGVRRLQSPHKNLYRLKVMIESFSDFVHHKGKPYYIDTNGVFFRWVKNKTWKLISHKIEKMEKKDIATLIWVNNIPFPFFVKRPPKATIKYANILYNGNHPSILYSFSEVKQKKSWRKV